MGGPGRGGRPGRKGWRKRSAGTIGRRRRHYRWTMVTAFVLIDAEPARVAALAEEIAAVDGVAEAYSVAGHADIVAVVRVRRVDELATVVTGRLHALAGITDTRTLIAFQSYSRRDLDAMWELGAPDQG